MAITLVTGTPGAGKTLNTIEMVHKRAEQEARAVYYANIDGISFDGWHKMDDIEGADLTTAITPHSWYNAPDGSILLIDECQDFYPSMSSSAKQPEYIMRFATHRHQGYDVYLITQGPNLINSKLKDWVTPHIHYRRIFGGNKTYRYTNEEVVNNIRDVNAIAKAAIKQRVKLNQKYFGTYHSASVHTKNTRVNKKLLAILAFGVLSIPLAMWYAYSAVSAKMEPVAVPQTQAIPGNGGAVGGVSPLPTAMPGVIGGREQRFDPMTMYQPRIAAMPETAPAYDELRKPQDFPRPNCLKNGKRCECYTQQGTLMQDYPRDLCLANVKRGYFDPTKPRSGGNGSAQMSPRDMPTPGSAVTGR